MKERTWGAMSWAAGISLLGSWLLVATCFEPPWFASLIPGWLTILLNGLLAHGLYAWALRQRSDEWFLAISFGGSILRAALVVAAVLLVKRLATVAFMPFLATVLTGYFVFLFVEIRQLHLYAGREGCPAR